MKIPNYLEYFNSYGGFDTQNNEYVIHLEAGHVTPKPWVNILANPKFGTLVTESGSMFTWFENSSLFRLTPRVDDYLSEESSELVYLKNEKSGSIWLATPGNPKRGDPPFLVRHGLGYSVFEHEKEDLFVKTTVFSSLKKPRKYVVIEIKNLSKEEKHLSATYFSQFVLDEFPEKSRAELSIKFDENLNLILAENPYSKYFHGVVAYLGTSVPKPSFCLDRTEFFGLTGQRGLPKGLQKSALPNKNTEANDPAGILRANIVLSPLSTKKIVFYLGISKKNSLNDVNKELKNKDLTEKELGAVQRYWKNLNEKIQIETPNEPLNILFNSRLLYQTVSSRFWAKLGFYQPGGAFGFRDQLQDADALLWAEPQTVRNHLLLAASRQFPGGDVQHWWHPPRGDGVRSQSSDAHLWLVYVLNHYLKVTSDWKILDEKISYLEPHKPEHHHNSYFVPISTEEKFTLYEHALAAIERTLYLSGEHGLPLILSGDWNDSLSRIGVEKKGESVFVGMFLVRILKDFIPICEKRKDEERAKRYKDLAKKLTDVINRECWDGKWYLRAFWDDGSKLGTSTDTACRIDGLVQNWSVISQVATPEYSEQALQSVNELLFDRENKIVKLLDPPFTKGYKRDPGYIVTYPPGTRENGGAYNHNAAWTAQAFALLGNGNTALEVIDAINPINHTQGKKSTERYGGEPYALAGDIYSWGGYAGKAGWTWYTGSAAVLYNVLMEDILGIKITEDKICLDPCVPVFWKNFSVNLKYRNACYKINFQNSRGVSKGVKKITCDGKEITNKTSKLLKDGKNHTVEVEMG